MSSSFALPGQTLTLFAHLSDGEESFPISVKSTIKDNAGVTLGEVSLTHIGNGLFNGTYIMPDSPAVFAMHAAYEGNTSVLADYDLGMQAFSQQGSLLDPQDIWTHPTRTLSEPTPIETAPIMAEIKTELEKLDSYTCMMTSVVNSLNGVQTLICYLNKNGQTLLTTLNARIEIYDDVLSLVWSGTAETPDTRGVFKITKTGAEALLSGDKVYVVKVVIDYNSKDYSTIQTFFTVG